MAEYLREEQVANIIFVDRSARPAWIGVNEYWNTHFPRTTPKPGFFFVNSDGFNPTLVANPHIQQNDLLKALMKILGPSSGREEYFAFDDIVHRFNEVFTGLRTNRDKPLVLFDTCAHTGSTLTNITAILEAAGFTDIRIITANSPDSESGIVPAARIDKYKRLTSCYPFGTEVLVKKGTDVISEPSKGALTTATGRFQREEIKRIIQDEGR